MATVDVQDAATVGVRALGGRREAEKWLGQQDDRLDVTALRHALEEKARS